MRALHAAELFLRMYLAAAVLTGKYILQTIVWFDGKAALTSYYLFVQPSCTIGCTTGCTNVYIVQPGCTTRLVECSHYAADCATGCVFTYLMQPRLVAVCRLDVGGCKKLAYATGCTNTVVETQSYKHGWTHKDVQQVN
jgi:hypothetical protein